MLARAQRSANQLPDFLSALKEEVNQILVRNSVTSPNNRDHLSHFTTQQNLIRILQNYRAHRVKEDCFLSLWLSDISCLNDPLEGKALFQFVDDHSGPEQHPKQWGAKSFSEDEWANLSKIVEWIRGNNARDTFGRRDGLSRRILVCSFTQEMDRLDLWRAYGANGEGICLSMPLSEAVARIRSYPSPVSQIFHVRYLDEEKATVWTMLRNHLEPIYSIAEAMGLASDQALKLKATVIADCEKIFHLYKHGQYLNEHEMRLIKTYDIDLPGCFANSTEFFEPGIRADLELNRLYSYSDPFFLGGKDSRIIIGPRVAQAERFGVTLSTYLKDLWGANAPQVYLSTVPYR
jgi:hypothetical protein